MEANIEMDQQSQDAQAALLSHYAPRTRVRRVRWSQGETRVLELGTGSPLLLVHGGLSSVSEWVPVLPALARSHRVIAIDRPGHGMADAFDYRGVDLFAHASRFLGDIMDALGIASADVVGNSLGGLYALALALDAPERVSKLVLAGKPVGCDRHVPKQLRALGLPLVGQWLGRRLLSNITRDDNRKFWEEVLVARPEMIDDSLLDADVAHTRRNVDTMLGLIKCLAARGGLRHGLVLGERWAQLRMPTAFLWGEHDAFGPPEQGEAIAARNPNLRVIRIPRAGHLPWIDQPDRVVSEIILFLAS